MTMRIIFSNTTGDVLVQAGKQEYKFKATSGKDDCMNNQNCEAIPYKGPTPKGAYYIIAQQLDDPNFMQDSLRRITGDWGDFRIPLYPQASTKTHERERMYIHGGDTLGSAGCIDVAGGKFGDANSDKIKELIKKHASQGVIRVDVINSKIMEYHKNQSREVILPKELQSFLKNNTHTILNALNVNDMEFDNAELKTFFADLSNSETFKQFNQADEAKIQAMPSQINEETVINSTRNDILEQNMHTTNQFGISPALKAILDAQQESLQNQQGRSVG